MLRTSHSSHDSGRYSDSKPRQSSGLSPAVMTLLDKGYDKRFGLGTPTIQLLGAVHTDKERLALSIVALLDLDRHTLLGLIPPEQWQFIDACHHYLRQIHGKQQTLKKDPLT